jgi:hypothetical protein
MKEIKGYTPGIKTKNYNSKTGLWEIKDSNNRIVMYLPQCMDGEDGKYETSANLELACNISSIYEENIKLHQQVEVLREALQDIVWWHTENLPDSTFDSILYKCKAALKQTEQ